jgi:hypothetical protein
MTKSTGVGRGGYRKGARRPKLPNIVKREKQIISFQAGDFAYFVAVVGSVEAAKKQIEQWVRAYPMARGETDRLLAQSPVAGKLLSYLEATDGPQELIDELESLIVARDSDEVKIAEGVVQVGDSLIV